MHIYTLFSITIACVLFALTSAKGFDQETAVNGIEKRVTRRKLHKRREVKESASSRSNDDEADEPPPPPNPVQAALAPVGDILKQIGGMLSPDKPKKKKKKAAGGPSGKGGSSWKEEQYGIGGSPGIGGSSGKGGQLGTGY